MKTFHELNEAFPSLTDENGQRKPFERFLNDVQCIHQTYNRNYLQAEYNFAVASAASARRWMEVEKDAEAVRRAVQATAKTLRESSASTRASSAKPSPTTTPTP